jgi:cysteinyl-tRNA synthetase
LKNAEKGLDRLHRLKEKLELLCKNEKSDKVDEKKLKSGEKRYLKDILEFEKGFEKAMDDDFNTPGAIAVLFEFVNVSNKFLGKNKNPDEKLCGYVLDVLLKLGGVLTLFEDKTLVDDSAVVERLQKILRKYDEDVKKADVEEMLDVILNLREKARAKRDWETADNIRKDLEDVGFEIQDTEDGPVWRKK